MSKTKLEFRLEVAEAIAEDLDNDGLDYSAGVIRELINRVKAMERVRPGTWSDADWPGSQGHSMGQRPCAACGDIDGCHLPAMLRKAVEHSSEQCPGGDGCQCCGNGCDCGCRDSCPRFITHELLRLNRAATKWACGGGPNKSQRVLPELGAIHANGGHPEHVPFGVYEDGRA
jgi:hypothetical protein